MFTYSTARTFFGQLTNNSSSTNLTLGDTLINQFSLELLHKFPFLIGEQTFLLQTYPSQQFYTLPLQLRKITTVQINVGNTGGISTTGNGFNWPVKECPTLEEWNKINLVNTIQSDIPQYFFYYNGQLGIYPRPSVGYNPITVKGQVEIASTNTADYTTGTITSVPYTTTLTGSLAVGALGGTLSGAWTLPTGTYQMIFSSTENRLVTLTNGSTAVTWLAALTEVATSAITIRTSGGGDIVTGNTTVWTTAMNGYYFQTTDLFWYKVDTVYSNTQLSLMTDYKGLVISAGTATYILGQSSIIPPAYQLIPIYRAANIYYTVVAKDLERAGAYKGLADTLEASMRVDMGAKSTDPTLQDFDQPTINPNLTVNITGSHTLD